VPVFGTIPASNEALLFSILRPRSVGGAAMLGSPR
jgi:hypothetical protein